MSKRQCDEQTPYGGQAVIEGVMMRGPRYFAVACRRENGEIVIQQESVEAMLKRFQWLNKPFLRGTLAMLDAMALGMKSLMFSANIAMEDLEPKKTANELDDSAEKPGKTKQQSINDLAIGGTMVLGLALGVGIFFVTPQLIVGLLDRWIESALVLNMIVGGVKLTMFVLYVAAISMMKDIRRVFEYHGAEHKVINTLESKEDLLPCNFSKHGTIHPRCGTNFILIVLVISIIAFCFLGWSSAWYERVFYRLLLLPIVAGVAYEVIRFAGRHRESRLLKALLLPGLAMQKLTTRPPSDDQVEVAHKALQAVMDREESDA